MYGIIELYGKYRRQPLILGYHWFGQATQLRTLEGNISIDELGHDNLENKASNITSSGTTHRQHAYAQWQEERHPPTELDECSGAIHGLGTVLRDHPLQERGHVDAFLVLTGNALGNPYLCIHLCSCPS